MEWQADDQKEVEVPKERRRLYDIGGETIENVRRYNRKAQWCRCDEPPEEVNRREAKGVKRRAGDACEESRIWSLLCEAQHLAPDNVTINWQLLKCWPNALERCNLIDGIGHKFIQMTREALTAYIVELDGGFIEPTLKLVDAMRTDELRLIRVQRREDHSDGSPSDIGLSFTSQLSDAWEPRWMSKQDILIRMLADQPRCAAGYRRLAATLVNPFERIVIEGEAGACDYNRTQLLEKAEILDPISG